MNVQPPSDIKTPPKIDPPKSKVIDPESERLKDVDADIAIKTKAQDERWEEAFKNLKNPDAIKEAAKDAAEELSGIFPGLTEEVAEEAIKTVS